MPRFPIFVVTKAPDQHLLSVLHYMTRSLKRLEQHAPRMAATSFGLVLRFRISKAVSKPLTLYLFNGGCQ